MPLPVVHVDPIAGFQSVMLEVLPQRTFQAQREEAPLLFEELLRDTPSQPDGYLPRHGEVFAVSPGYSGQVRGRCLHPASPYLLRRVRLVPITRKRDRRNILVKPGAVDAARPHSSRANSDRIPAYRPPERHQRGLLGGGLIIRAEIPLVHEEYLLGTLVDSVERNGLAEIIAGHPVDEADRALAGVSRFQNEAGGVPHPAGVRRVGG